MLPVSHAHLQDARFTTNPFTSGADDPVTRFRRNHMQAQAHAVTYGGPARTSGEPVDDFGIMPMSAIDACDATSDAAVPVLAVDDDRLTDADLDAMWAAEMERRDIEAFEAACAAMELAAVRRRAAVLAITQDGRRWIILVTDRQGNAVPLAGACTLRKAMAAVRGLHEYARLPIHVVHEPRLATV